MKKSLENLVSKFETENSNVSLNDVIAEFSKFMQEEGVDPWNYQMMRDDYQQVISRRIAEKVNKTNEMTIEEVNFVTDYLHRQIEIKGEEYITVPVEKINDDTIKDIIIEAIDKISTDESEKGNVPKDYLCYIDDEADILEDYFYVIIAEMKEEEEDDD